MSKFPSFIRLNNNPYIYHTVFPHSSVDGHLGCFYLLAIVNNAAMNMDAHIPFQVPAFNSCGFPYVVKASSMGGIYLLILRSHMMFFTEWGWEDVTESQTKDSDRNRIQVNFATLCITR